MRILRPAVALTAVLALGLAGCSTSTSDDETTTAGDETTAATETESGELDYSNVPEGDGTQTIYLVSKGFQHQFWQAVNTGAQQAGEEFGYQVEFVGPDDETKVTQQLDQLTAALNSNPAAIGFAALDSEAAGSTLEEIDAAGIPVVAFDSGVDSDIPVTTVTTDNVGAAATAAEHMIELVGGEGTVGLVCHDQTSQTGKDRCNGFIDYIEENAPDINLLEPQYAGDVNNAASTANAIIQANPDIKGIYGTNEASAIGVLQGATESGTDVTVVGFDSGKAQIEAIEAGTEAGAITQSPVKMGYDTVVAAILAIDGQEVPSVIDSGFYWYDAENINDEEIAENLYQ